MALLQGTEHFTKWTHVENGKVFIRRLHRMEIQALDGRLYAITGEKLPDYIQTSCGQAYKGEHLAQILLRPGKFGPPPVPSRPWPSFRDVCQIGLGMLTLLLLRFVWALAFAAF
jgi:hypothetical protein